MKYIIFIALLAFVAAYSSGIIGFKSQRASDYKDTNPKFDIQKQLAGPLISEGVIYGPTGKVASRFVAKMQGTWEGETGTLFEEFVFNNGTKQVREWKIKLLEDGKLEATAGDVIGTATGEISGSTMVLRYKIKLTEAAGGHVLSAEDWIYLMDNGVMINKSEMRKFGVKVAELVGNIRPLK